MLGVAGSGVPIERSRRPTSTRSGCWMSNVSPSLATIRSGRNGCCRSRAWISSALNIAVPPTNPLALVIVAASAPGSGADPPHQSLRHHHPKKPLLRIRLVQRNLDLRPLDQHRQRQFQRRQGERLADAHPPPPSEREEVTAADRVRLPAA